MSLLDGAQAADLLNVPVSWIKEEARCERIPHAKLGRYRRFDRDELLAWWSEHRRGPMATPAE